MAEKIEQRFIVCNVDGSTHQKRFRIHETLNDAVGQARVLAEKHTGNHFMIMEAIGGFVFVDGKLVDLRVFSSDLKAGSGNAKRK